MWLSEMSDMVARKLVEQGLDSDSKDVYAYGIEVVLSNFLTIMVSIIIAVLLVYIKKCLI